MHAFEVWAPNAKRVEVEAAGSKWPMALDEKGWWRRKVPTPAAEIEYRVYVDGEGPFPDPRSLWQPHGIHGPSRTLIHSEFSWSDAGWKGRPWREAILYELHIGTFTPVGTFQSAIEKLGHLLDLGVTHVELMPVNSFPGSRGWGYDGVGLFAPQESYGGPSGLKELVDACHARGLAVLLDVVYNHFGPSGNYWGRFGPYFNPRVSTPWGSAINFDGCDSDEVRRFFCDNALMWLRDYHFDGLRLDAVHEYIDRSAYPFLEQLGVEVKKLEAELGKPLVVVAENDLNDSRPLHGPERGGFGLQAQWNDDFHHALHAALTGEINGYYSDYGSIGDICAGLEQGYVYSGRYSKHRRRNQGRPAAGLSGDHFIVFSQNHDQVGNRAKGDRSGRLMNAARLKAAAALVVLSPFIPLIFQGEEWGASAPFLYFTDHAEPELQKAVREGRRAEFASFGWRPEEVPDPQDPSSFERSKLKWSELDEKPHAELLAWYKALVELRRSNHAADRPAAEVETLHDEAERWLSYRRGDVLIECNFGSHVRIAPALGRNLALLMASSPGVEMLGSGIRLPPDATAILRIR